MTETSSERMRRILNATHGYRLTGGSSADWELNACGAGLDEVERSIEGLLNDLFPQTTSPERLNAWEALVRPQPADAPLETRREMTARRFSMSPGRFCPGELASLLPAAGVQGEVEEGENGLLVLVGRQLGLSPEEAHRELDLLLPAHLNWEWVEEMNWTSLNAWVPSFEALDDRELTWAEWEALTLEQLHAFEESEET